MGIKKRGIFFSIDALIALLIIFIIIIVAVPITKQKKVDSKLDQDILVSLSSITAAEFDNAYVQSLISSGVITDANKSLLEHIGNFYVTDPIIASNIANEFLSSIDTTESIGIWLENNLVSAKNSTPFEEARQIDTSRQIISGIMLGQNITGYSARAFLSSNVKTAYSYFGGYVGDGNITMTVEYNGTITDADIEIASNKDFEIYINNVFAGNYSKSASTTSPSSYDLSAHIGKFSSGKNLVEFRAPELYVAGGFVKVKYQSEPIIEPVTKYYFPGIQGLINIYDGLYVPGVPQSMEISLDLESNFTTFLNIGKLTVYNGTTNGRQTITIPNSELLSKLNYNQLANKTVPIRLGLRNVSLIYNTQRVDILSVVDLSGSMEDNCPGGSANPGETPCKINDAKNATIDLIDAVLNISNNRIALVGFESVSRKSDFHNLSNNTATLKSIVNNVWDASGSTCICCGILKAISCFSPEIFVDNFNGQSNGANPSGWTVSQTGGAIDITTSQPLEGNAGVVIAKTSTNQNQNPSMHHIFNSQEDPLNVEFLVRHDTGTGRFRLEVEGVDSFGSYDDYIVLKMYSGAIRNSDTALVSYSTNTTYKIRLEITPSINRYNLYVNDVLRNSSLTTVSTENDIGRIRFTTETATINYKIDSVNVSLASRLCELFTNRSREMIVMSDGEANRACGVDPSPDWDGDSVTTGDYQDQAIEAACIARQKHNITVHAIAFDVGDGSVAEQTMQGIAACGNGGFYTANVTQLSQIYKQLTQNILATFNAQTFNATAGQTSRLHPNSYIAVQYLAALNPFGISITTEQSFTNSTSVNFSIPDGATPISATAISYSGALWTNILRLNNETIYNLSNYGSNYIDLGDPYAIRIDHSKLKQNNTLSLTASAGPLANSTQSSNNRVIYTVVKNISAYSPISANRQGCIWTIDFEDNTNITVRIPANYTGASVCRYSHASTIYDVNDAMQTAAYNLFRQLDIDSDGKIDFIFGPNEVTIDTTDVQGIPFPWSTEIQVRRWV